MEHLSTERILSLVSPLQGEAKDAFVSLLTCARCRAKALSLLEEDTHPDLPLPDPLWMRVAPLIARRRAELRRDQKHAETLFDELLDQPLEKRLGLLRADPRFHSPGLVRLLLAASEAATEADIDRAEHLAGLALEAAQALPSRVGEATQAELRTVAWARIGDLRRLRGDLKEAEAAFQRATYALAAESLDSVPRAVFCRLLARLRKDQGEVDEALALYGRAAVLFDTLEEFAELGETLVEEAWLRHEELDPESARSIFDAALSMIDRKLKPRLALSARRGLALCCADLGRPAEAEEVLVEGQEVFSLLSDPIDQLRIVWMKAQVAERSGDPAAAVPLLSRVLHGLIGQGVLFDAALAALELARLYIEKGFLDELEQLRSEIEPLAALSDRHPAAWETVAFALSQVGGGGKGSALLLDNASQYLTRVRHDPWLQFHPAFKPSEGEAVP
ncbi:MAG TPA: hypothetical protein VGX68_07430 [Thermoanaerobaculia bacterium]|jgi:tetratricopeptide (TPR) repeat protein|nr:hypothetical protein [Thermoanaerobaculia bacterium]